MHLCWCQRLWTSPMIPPPLRTPVWWRLGWGTMGRGATGPLVRGETEETVGSTSAFAVPLLWHQRVLWQGDREPGASSEGRGPTPALLPAQRPPHTGEDKHTNTHIQTQFINVGALQLMVKYNFKYYKYYYFVLSFFCSAGLQCCVARPC